MSSTFAESLARGAVRDDDSFMGALARGYGLAGILDDMNARAHERDVNGRIDQILAASNGGQQDLSTLDPKLYSDRVGMEALGKVSQQLSQTGEYQNKIFNNGIQQAKNLYGLAQGYMADFKSAVDANDSQRALNIYGNMMNRMNLPYRFVQDGDGFRVYHITPEGERDMGNMSLMDVYKMTADQLNNEQMFLKGSAAYSMTNWETNQKYMADPAKWRYGVTKDGKQLAMVPQTFQKDGQMVAGFYVQGLGNRTLDQLDAAGITVAGAMGTGIPKAIAGGGRGGRRGLGGSNGGGDDGEALGQNAMTPDGKIAIPTKFLGELRSEFKGYSKDPDTKTTDYNHARFLEQMYNAQVRLNGGKLISKNDFMADMQEAEEAFMERNASKLEGMSSKQARQAFRNFYKKQLAAQLEASRGAEADGKKTDGSAKQGDQQTVAPTQPSGNANVSDERKKQNASLVQKAKTSRPQKEEPVHGRDKYDPAPSGGLLFDANRVEDPAAAKQTPDGSYRIKR